MWHIARSDGYGTPADHKMHFDALVQLIQNWNCEVTNSKDMSWYPLEAIELCSHGLQQEQVEAFAIATAILIIDDHLYERFDYMDFRLENLGLPTYEGLPEKYRDPIMAGIRLLEDAPKVSGS